MSSPLRNLRMLTRYSAWANERMFDAVSKLPAGEPMAKRATGFGNMVHTLNHNYVVDLIWKGHLEGKAHGFKARNTEAPPPFEELRRSQRAVDEWYVACADAMTEAQHDEVIEFKFVDGGAGAMTRGDMLLHIVNHKTYHRGYVADMFYQAGARPPTMDLPVFLRDAYKESR